MSAQVTVSQAVTVPWAVVASWVAAFTACCFATYGQQQQPCSSGYFLVELMKFACTLATLYAQTDTNEDAGEDAHTNTSHQNVKPARKS